MLLVHIVPMLAGVVLSFKNLNTFTFHQLFDAPWTGLDNYEAILDRVQPAQRRLRGRRLEHGPLHVLDGRRLPRRAGSPSRCCSTATCAARSGRAR